jgi:hypothetical protein
LLSLVILAISAFPMAVAAQAAKIRLDVPEQPLSQSLRTLADSTGINVLFDTAKVAGRTAPAVHAHLSLDEALVALLEGSGLKHQFVDEKTVVLESVAEAGIQSSR